MTNPRIMEAAQAYVWADSSEASARAQRQSGTTGKHSRRIAKRDRRGLIWLIWFIWSIWSVWFNQINDSQTNKTNHLAPCSLEQSHGRIKLVATKRDAYERSRLPS